MKDIFRRAREAAEDELRIKRLAALQEARARLHKNSDGLSGAGHLELAACCESLGDYEGALAALRDGVERSAAPPPLYRRYIGLLRDLNRTPEAIEIARQARVKFPDQFFFTLAEGLLLPVLYANSGEKNFYRQRFKANLAQIAGGLDLGTPDGRQRALAGLKHRANFLLAYQGEDDRELQTMYGAIVHKIMAANYPQWSEKVPMPADDGLLRIGYISGRFYDHSVSRTHLGWLQGHARDRFQVFTYHIGNRTDAWTDAARETSSVFRHLPGDPGEVCRTILSDRLHILVFLDVGMDHRTIPLAALRLAPIQCTTWGHPVTSGLPTLDYFLSSELMEPPGAQAFYTEELVRLPGIGVCYRKPFVPEVSFYKTRADFGIRENATVYLSCQSAFKYLPPHDDIYPEIAKKVPHAQFIFLERDQFIRNDFEKRLKGAFAQAGVPMGERVLFLPRLDNFSYQNLNLLSDICLDTMEWSGCNTTMEAIACRLPVVTLPGKFMRGRHSSAILTQAGVTETIAPDQPGYIEIAARLALDLPWRERVVRDLIAGYPKLYSDTQSVRALEDFYVASLNRRAFEPAKD